MSQNSAGNSVAHSVVQLNWAPEEGNLHLRIVLSQMQHMQATYACLGVLARPKNEAHWSEKKAKGLKVELPQNVKFIRSVGISIPMVHKLAWICSFASPARDGNIYLRIMLSSMQHMYATYACVAVFSRGKKEARKGFGCHPHATCRATAICRIVKARHTIMLKHMTFLRIMLRQVIGQIVLLKLCYCTPNNLWIIIIMKSSA